MLKVKQAKVQGKVGYGITDGKKWFFYAYTTEERATHMLPHFSTAQHIKVNISYPAPETLV